MTTLGRLSHGALGPSFCQGFALSSAEEREAVLDCLVVFLDTLEAVTSAQGELAAQPLEHPASGATETTLREQAAAPGTGKGWARKVVCQSM